MWRIARVGACVVAAAVAVFLPAEIDRDRSVPSSRMLACPARAAPPSEPPDEPILATLAPTHAPDRLILTATTPDEGRFDRLLRDRVSGKVAPLDPRLLALLRALAATRPGGRVELVSGYRSPKLNEMLRKKGHHVAKSSQHTLAHAVDFRIVPPGEAAMSPDAMAAEVKALGFRGGIGVYLGATDRFVHCDVGRERHWLGSRAGD